MIRHEEVLFTSHRSVMTEALISTQDTVFHFYFSYLVKHILMFGNHRPLEQRFYHTQVQDLVSDRHTNAMSGLKE